MRRLVERAVLYWFQFLRRRPRHHRDLADNQRRGSIVEATLSHDQFYYIYLLFNELSLYPYMVRKPSISVILHDRYPAIYVNDHIWKCTAGFLSLLVWWPF